MKFPMQYPVACHTEHVGPGSTFVAIHGQKQNGIDFIPEALKRGATRIVIAYDAEIPSTIRDDIEHYKAQILVVRDTRHTLAQLSAQAAGYPAQQLKIIGITGTKGKTTTAWLLAHILQTAGHKTALLSTVHNRIGPEVFPTHLTTQQPDYVHQFFKLCVERKVEYVVMEVAAQAVSLHRVAGIEFDGIIFTNFGQEHAEFYATQEAYFAAKSVLLNHRKKSASVLLNNDDEEVAQLKDMHSRVISYGCKATSDAHIKYDDQVSYTAGLVGDLSIQAVHLLGKFNLYNCAAAALMAQELNIERSAIESALSTFKRVPGRLEVYQLKTGARCIIDYAHNPSSYEQLLPVLRRQTEQLIVVFGAGGDRDKNKRPLMGTLASRYADYVLLTSDNPRLEDPHQIIADIQAGIPHEKQSTVVCEVDRKKAIHIAYQLAQPGAIIALLGKGPDEYQIIGATTSYFSEKEIIQSLEEGIVHEETSLRNRC